VSTILKALQKLEQDRQASTLNGAAGRPGFDPKPRMHQRPVKYRLGKIGLRWIWLATAFIGLVGGFIVAGTGVHSSGPNKTMPSLTAAITLPTQTESTRMPEIEANSDAMPMGAGSALEAEKDLASEQQTDRGNAPILSAAAVETANVSIKPDAFNTAPLSTAHMPGAQTDVLSKKDNNQKKPPPEVVSQPDPPAETPPATTDNLFGRAPLLTDRSLEVQAIAWSPVADECLAVINNHIVREGNSVDGYSVITIGQDQVLVKQGTQQFVVPFGSR
jgi:hypothetical protein